MRLAWQRSDADRDLSEAWRHHYQRVAPAVVGYLAAQGLARPADVVVPLFLQAVGKIEALHADAKGLRVWAMFGAHRTIAKARRRHPGPVCVPPLVDGLSDDERDVLLLRLFGGLSYEQVAATVRKRRSAIASLERRALQALRDRVGTGVYSLLGAPSDISEADIATLIAGDDFPDDPALGPLAAAIETLRTSYVVPAPTHIEDQHIAEITQERADALPVGI